MKIQIRSFIKGGNHGQYFQALGLVQLLKEILPDSDVTHLNYNNHVRKELRIQIKDLLLPKYLVMRLYWKKRLKFSSFDWGADLSVYGSDMIWHLESKLAPIDKVFFGDKDTGKKIAYGPSVGYRGEKEPAWIKDFIRTFRWIGVRDKNTFKFANDHGYKSPFYVIDPSFYLLNSQYLFGINHTKKRTPVLSVYSTFPYRIVDCFLSGGCKKIMNKHFEKIQYLGYFPKNLFFRYLLKQFSDPLNIFYDISRSKLLLTNTFHGVMMALITKTPFIAVRSPNLDSRLDSPIKEVFGSHRLMTIESLMGLQSDDYDQFITSEDFHFDFLNQYIMDSRRKIKNAVLDVINENSK